MSLFFTILISLIKSYGDKINVKSCSFFDWLAIFFYVDLVILMIFISVKLYRYEYNLKAKYGGVGQCESDIVLDKKNLRKLLSVGFFGGFVAGAFGLGGGVVFSPILLSLGMPPRVSSSTGSYLITFSKISSCLIYAINGKILWDYALWISLWSVLGAFFS